MEIGIHGFDLDATQYYRDLGVTWTKISGEFSPLFREERASAAAARELGMQVVVDLRTGADRLNELWAESGRKYGEDEAQDVPRTSRVAETLAQDAADFVARHADLVSNWEFWGECYCPWVSDGVFGDKVTYTVLLKALYRAIKEVQPEARIWTGGNGTNLDPEWVMAILQDDCGGSFDVLNLHPFWISLRDLVVTSKLLENSLGYMRRRLREDARDQPFAATEWGHPHTPERTQLWSNVEGGLMSLDYAEACEWFERDLQAFERWGFEVVIVHELMDHADRPGAQRLFWGNYCGLRDMDKRAKPTWDIIQRWAWQGRGG